MTKRFYYPDKLQWMGIDVKVKNDKSFRSCEDRHCLYWHNNPFEIPCKVDIEIHSTCMETGKTNVSTEVPVPGKDKRNVKMCFMIPQ